MNEEQFLRTCTDSASEPARVISTTVRTEILARIQRAEAEHGVRVLLAVESGSRAWGFESPNSDYDARFIYVHRRDWYLGLNEPRDVIEYDIVDEIDLNGWDLRKALRLFWKSNPAFVEWIQSPIIYRQDGCFAEQARAMLAEVYSCEHGIYHYRNMARTNFRGYLKSDLVPLKKYFYVLRPLLAVRWLERYGSAAPVEFGKLLHLVENDSHLLSDIHALLEKKRAAPEMGLQPPVPSIHSFIENELARLTHVNPAKSRKSGNLLGLDELFRRCINEASAG